MPRIRGKVEIHKDDTKNLAGKRLPDPSHLWVAFMYQADETAPKEVLKVMRDAPRCVEC